MLSRQQAGHGESQPGLRPPGQSPFQQGPPGEQSWRGDGAEARVHLPISSGRAGREGMEVEQLLRCGAFSPGQAGEGLALGSKARNK